MMTMMQGSSLDPSFSWAYDVPVEKIPVKRKSPFLGFRRKPSGTLDTHSAGFGVWSDWQDLNELCVWMGVSLGWV